MHPEQMLKRAPHSPMAGTGWLHGWRLTFGGEDIGWDGALATVVEDPTSKVFVVLYDMTKEDEKNLDRWEGSELGIHKKIRCRVRHTVGALPRRDGRCRRNRRRPSGIRSRSTHPPGTQHRPRHVGSAADYYRERARLHVDKPDRKTSDAANKKCASTPRWLLLPVDGARTGRR
jgi:hypothetical protein